MMRHINTVGSGPIAQGVPVWKRPVRLPATSKHAIVRFKPGLSGECRLMVFENPHPDMDAGLAPRAFFSRHIRA
jgi:hypothetical protein